VPAALHWRRPGRRSAVDVALDGVRLQAAARTTARLGAALRGANPTRERGAFGDCRTFGVYRAVLSADGQAFAAEERWPRVRAELEKLGDFAEGGQLSAGWVDAVKGTDLQGRTRTGKALVEFESPGSALGIFGPSAAQASCR